MADASIKQLIQELITALKTSVGIEAVVNIAEDLITITNVMGMFTVTVWAVTELQDGEIIMKAPTCTLYANNGSIAVKGMSQVLSNVWYVTIDQVFPEPDAVKVDMVTMDASHTIHPAQDFVIL